VIVFINFIKGIRRLVYKDLIEKCRKNLSISDKAPAISLHERNTSLIPERNPPDKL
jgi:threonine synthase